MRPPATVVRAEFRASSRIPLQVDGSDEHIPLARLLAVGALIAVVATPVTAGAAWADGPSILTEVTITNVTVTPKNDGSGRNAVSASWTAPVASDGSSPLWYEVDLSTSSTEPAPGGALTSIGTTTATQSADLFDHFGMSGTYYLWVTARFDYTGRIVSRANVPVQYTRPPVHDKDSWTPTEFSLHVSGADELAFTWRNYSNLSDATIELAGPKGVASYSQRSPSTLMEARHLFENLPGGIYRARVRQTGVASEPGSADGSVVLDHTYEWSAWTEPVKVGTPSRVARPSLRVQVPKRWIGNVDYAVEVKRPSAGTGYVPTLFQVQIRYATGSGRWLREDMIAWKWSKQASLTAKFRGYRMENAYQVRVRACTSGDYRVYDARMPVKVCGAYSKWSRTARLHARPATFTK